MMPAPDGLPLAGQMMPAIRAFAVIVWMIQARDDAVSAVVIGALMIFLLAYAPDGVKPVNAAAMTATGLDRRIALVVPSRVDARTNHSVIGARVVGFLPSFIVPSTTARVACLVPIMMGFILAFKVEKRSRFAGLLVITAAQTASV